jgi:proline iminopeptidase
VVATWDQRGTGKSANELAPTSTLTVEQMVNDAIDVTNYLRDRFAEQKIYLVGNSWGTILGVLAAQRRPELYHAFIGSGQMVSPVDTDRMFYDDTLAWAERTGDTALVETLRTDGPPPYDDLWKYETALSHEHDWNPYPGTDNFQEKGEMPGNIFVEEYSLMEKLHTLPAFMDTFSVLYPQLHGSISASRPRHSRSRSTSYRARTRRAGAQSSRTSGSPSSRRPTSNGSSSSDPAIRRSSNSPTASTTS